jgi:hypothetical protein
VEEKLLLLSLAAEAQDSSSTAHPSLVVGGKPLPVFTGLDHSHPDVLFVSYLPILLTLGGAHLLVGLATVGCEAELTVASADGILRADDFREWRRGQLGSCLFRLGRRVGEVGLRRLRDVDWLGRKRYLLVLWAMLVKGTCVFEVSQW